MPSNSHILILALHSASDSPPYASCFCIPHLAPKRSCACRTWPPSRSHGRPAPLERCSKAPTESLVGCNVPAHDPYHLPCRDLDQLGLRRHHCLRAVNRGEVEREEVSLAEALNLRAVPQAAAQPGEASLAERDLRLGAWPHHPCLEHHRKHNRRRPKNHHRAQIPWGSIKQRTCPLRPHYRNTKTCPLSKMSPE